ncbi:response regulator transcription factor [Labrys sp. KNU-23]|uniref:response regulator transcription factor n=1 Tax=Labrys sp. KNU-23 TaxID=2789216 RepID=UPI0011EE92A0|nr:response regulator transcription factor [Labrys sp. KNU-23]QEN87596.1 response regulator transcription factor [Labrys sp. KNU-23]
MSEEIATVYVVDDDPMVRGGLDSLLRSVGYRVRCFASPREFIQHPRTQGPSCLVLDVRMPGQSGLDFQTELAGAGDAIPIVFLTGHGDVPMSVRAIKAGAVEFLLKPFREQDLLDAVAACLEKSRADSFQTALGEDLRKRYATLSQRQQEVMALVVQGLLNKQTAAELELSEITVKIHRGQVMRKMQAQTLADLIRMADRLGLPAKPAGRG